MAKTYSQTKNEECEFEVKRFETALRRASGKDAADRVATTLAQFGWQEEIAGITSAACREAVLRALRLMAVSRSNADKRERDIERRKFGDWVERGGPPDMFEDRYGSMTPQQLASQLPLEKYWVASQERNIAREDIPNEPDIAAELREQWLADLQRHEELARGLRFHVWAFGRMAGSHGASFAKAAE